MAAQVLYRKWRPQRFADVVGQEHVTTTLLNALASGRVAHAYLFCGPRGTGKTSLGRIFAKAVNCQKNGKGEPCNECEICLSISEGRALDLIEIDAASNRSIDDVQSLRDKVNFSPNQARYKVYLIDEVHQLSRDAASALLKTLEEPPPHTLFILATTDPQKLLATIVSRCQRFDLRRVPMSDVAQRLTQIAKAEGLDVSPEALAAIARATGGSLRDAIGLLEQLAIGQAKRLDIQDIRELLGIGGEVQARRLAIAALTGDTSGGLAAITEAMNEGLEVASFHREVLLQLRGILLLKSGARETVDLSAEQQQEVMNATSAVPVERVVRAIKTFAQQDLRQTGSSPLPLEVALIESATALAAEPQPVAARPQAAPAPARPAPPPARPLSSSPEGYRSYGERAPARPPIQQAPPARPSSPPPARPENRPPVPAAVASSSATISTNPDLFIRLRESWRFVADACKGKGQKMKLDALLRSGRPTGLEGDSVVIGFPNQFFIDKMKEEIENPGTRVALEEAFAKVLGKRHQVKCVISTRDERPAAGGHLLKAAVEEMGAKIVGGGPQP
ncbi:MAG: DNA polymerase III subunit gamma/tau [Chloroflexi bacterium]|nr:DNA polymerase III subunit gamma/tau [Chloroflexota bacterium]